MNRALLISKTAAPVSLALLCASLACAQSPAQNLAQPSAPPAALATTPIQPAQAAPVPDTRPIPDVETLMRQVEDNQKHVDEATKNYRYRSFTTNQDLNRDGSVKKTETEESEIFFVNGKEIERLLQKDGKDLSPKEQQKEQESVDKAIAKARQPKDMPKKDSNGVDISVSRILQLGDVSAPRRIVMNGRSTLVFNFTGNTKAKSKNTGENVMKNLAGTVWIDEADRQVTRMEARFEQNFHIAGGLLINIEKGTSFTFEQALVNNEVWLPTSIEGKGSARVLLVKAFNGRMRTTYSEYHKYVADVKILPGAKAVPDASTPDQQTAPVSAAPSTTP